MRTDIFRWVFTALIFASGTSQLLAQQHTQAIATPVASEPRVALVIGNAAYRDAPLKNPVNDATDMAQELRGLGFQVILRANASQRQMVEAVREFGNQLKRGGVGLFYYAGHGVQARGRNFLIPVDANLETESDLEFEALDANRVLAQMDEAGNRVNIVVLDACRDNPFTRSFRSALRGLAQLDAARGSFLAYATAPGSVAADGTGRNGIYTKHLLNSLKQPESKLEEVFKRVRLEVAKETGNNQIPWDSSSVLGDFYFRVPTVTEHAKPGQSEQERAELTKALEEERRRREQETAALKQQSEQERAQLAKELEEARKQREKDAELVRTEIDKLRMELQKISAEAATRPAADTLSGKPAQAEITTPPPAASAQRPQLAATVASSSSLANAPAAAGEWKERLVALEKLRGQLNFPKAMALLLNVKAEEELGFLVKYEALLKAMQYSSAYVLGVRNDGSLTFSRAWDYRGEGRASDAALDACDKGAIARSCRVVMINGEFQEKEFMEVAARLGAQTPDIVRGQYVGNDVPTELKGHTIVKSLNRIDPKLISR